MHAQAECTNYSTVSHLHVALCSPPHIVCTADTCATQPSAMQRYLHGKNTIRKYMTPAPMNNDMVSAFGQYQYSTRFASVHL